MVKPLKGISLLSDYGKCGRWYRINCMCGDDSHQCSIHINHPEHEDGYVLDMYCNGISSSKITIIQRIKYVYDVLINGTYYIESDMLLDEESTVNVYNALLNAYTDIVGEADDISVIDEIIIKPDNNDDQTVTLSIDVDGDDCIGIFTNVISKNEPYTTLGKRIRMAMSMLVNGYYENEIEVRLTTNDALLLINALKRLI